MGDRLSICETAVERMPAEGIYIWSPPPSRFFWLYSPTARAHGTGGTNTVSQNLTYGEKMPIRRPGKGYRRHVLHGNHAAVSLKLEILFAKRRRGRKRWQRQSHGCHSVDSMLLYSSDFATRCFRSSHKVAQRKSSFSSFSLLASPFDLKCQRHEQWRVDISPLPPRWQWDGKQWQINHPLQLTIRRYNSRNQYLA